MFSLLWVQEGSLNVFLLRRKSPSLLLNSFNLGSRLEGGWNKMGVGVEESLRKEGIPTLQDLSDWSVILCLQSK